MIRIAIALVAFWALAYLFAAFTFWALNPGDWGIGGRSFVVIMTMGISPAVAGAVAASVSRW